MKRTTYILIPGLGDEKAIFGWFYRAIAALWSRRGMPTRVMWPKWASAEPYEQKQKRLLTLLAEQKKQGSEIVLVGVSAGAALAYLTYSQGGGAKRFVAICGFTQLRPGDRKNPQLMRLSWYQAADAAGRASATLSQLKRQHILSFIPREDHVIDPKQQVIDGGQNRRLRSRGHLKTIVVSLVWHRRRIKAFVTSTD